MAPRKKPSHTKAAKAAQASTEDQPKADTVTQTGAGDAPAPAPETADDTPPAPAAKDPVSENEPEGADAATSASSVSASKTDAPGESDGGAAAIDVVALEAQLNALTARHDALLALVEALSNRIETAFEGPVRTMIEDDPGETQDLTPDPLDQHGPDDLEVIVTGPEKGFWRAGRKFDATPVVVPANELTGRQLAALEAEPALTVEVRARAALSAD